MTTFAIYLRSYLDLLGTFVLLSGVFFVLEAVAPAEKLQPLSKRFFNLAYYAVVLVFMLALVSINNPVYSRLLEVTRGGLLPRIIITPRGFFAQLCFALLFAVVWDVWQYWVHRLQHRWPALWETHKFHHSETALNSSTNGRHHISHHLLLLWLYLPVFIFFGLISPHAITAFVMFRLWGFINHANVRLHFGSLTALVSGPQWHRIHHSVHAKHRDKNFAAFFPFIDVLFGTYYKPEKEEYPATGLSGAKPAGDLRDATFEPLVGFYSFAKSRIQKADSLAKLTQES